MVTTVSQLRQITLTAGVEPSTDETPWATEHYIDTLGVRFRNNKPEKSGGFLKQSFDNGNTIAGVPRAIYSQIINGKAYTLYGTHSRLYAVVGSGLINITPFGTSSVAVGANLTTTYGTLPTVNPLTTVSGEREVTIAYGGDRFIVGDLITISGVPGAVNGIPAVELNAVHIVRAVTPLTLTVRVATAATSSGVGGGGAVVFASGKVNVTKIAHGLSDGDRIKISGASAFAGILSGQINAEFIVRNVTVDNFDIITVGTPTSYTATGGGAGVVYFPPISAGEINVSSGRGYGAGRYGVGLYGTSRSSTSGSYVYPRVWCFGRFGNLLLCSPGNGGLLYEWDGDTSVAPVKVSNSPDAINWFFVSDSIIVTFGAATGGGDQIENRILSCDQGNRTVWTGTAQNQVFDDAIEGAGRFISQVNVRGVNLLYTFNQCYAFEYIGLPNVWRIRKISDSAGLVGPNACIEVNGVAYWMGQQNFYQFQGSTIQVMPSNTSTRASNQRFVFTQLSTLQRYKTFVWFNEPFEEVNFHYPSQATGEVDSVAKTNIIEGTWANDEIERTAAEVPAPINFYPRMADFDGNSYIHEYGVDADGDSKSFSFTTKRFTLGKNETKLTAFIPDGVQSGTITVTIRGYQWPQALTPKCTQVFTVNPTSGRQPVNIDARYWTYTIEGDSVGQSFGLGNWMEEVQLAGNGA
ncbi:hypothetical protein UFOVP826_53 [uncultured Caudovirales phage]|uniref:Uncharacterized protein n=1 Tax=uncultured Caudovirales phage TaxID=2100421 RepID=A0A6J5P5N3_9CAUD|nr:hypothetical protein UFOVP826_53 [uncultured Caudovirales phage]